MKENNIKNIIKIVESLLRQIDPVTNAVPFMNDHYIRSRKTAEIWIEELRKVDTGQNINGIEKQVFEILDYFWNNKRDYEKESLFRHLLCFLQGQEPKKVKIPEKHQVAIITLCNVISALLLSCLNQPEQKRKTDTKPRPQSGNQKAPAQLTKKYVLTLAISAKETELLDALRSAAHLSPCTAEQLFRVKQWVLYDSEENWEKKCRSLFEIPDADRKEDGNDVYYIRITIHEPDERFGPDSSMVKMFDAFKDLAAENAKTEISERQPKESYENKGFYRV